MTDENEPEVTVINLAEHGHLLPPAAGLCQQCAKSHAPEDPHDARSLHYQYWFRRQRGRWPNWGDAMAHCSPGTQEAWQEALVARGVSTAEFVVEV